MSHSLCLKQCGLQEAVKLSTVFRSSRSHRVESFSLFSDLSVLGLPFAFVSLYAVVIALNIPDVHFAWGENTVDKKLLYLMLV